jgi:hypothetical protein
MGLHSNGSLLVLPIDIRLGWEWMAMANTLAYYYAVKNYSCSKLGPRLEVIDRDKHYRLFGLVCRFFRLTPRRCRWAKSGGCWPSSAATPLSTAYPMLPTVSRCRRHKTTFLRHSSVFGRNAISMINFWSRFTGVKHFSDTPVYGRLTSQKHYAKL